MTQDEYRTSKLQEAAAIFWGSPAGVEMLAILERAALPSIRAKTQYGTHEDVKMQMSINLVDSLAKQELIGTIRKLATPITKTVQEGYEPLEDEGPIMRSPEPILTNHGSRASNKRK